MYFEGVLLKGTNTVTVETQNLIAVINFFFFCTRDASSCCSWACVCPHQLLPSR